MLIRNLDVVEIIQYIKRDRQAKTDRLQRNACLKTVKRINVMLATLNNDPCTSLENPKRMTECKIIMSLFN